MWVISQKVTHFLHSCHFYRFLWWIIISITNCETGEFQHGKSLRYNHLCTLYWYFIRALLHLHFHILKCNCRWFNYKESWNRRMKNEAWKVNGTHSMMDITQLQKKRYRDDVSTDYIRSAQHDYTSEID